MVRRVRAAAWTAGVAIAAASLTGCAPVKAPDIMAPIEQAREVRDQAQGQNDALEQAMGTSPSSSAGSRAEAGSGAPGATAWATRPEPPPATPLQEGAAVAADGGSAAEFRAYAATDYDAVLTHYTDTLGDPDRVEDGGDGRVTVWEGAGFTVSVHSPDASGSFAVDTTYVNPG